MNTTPLLIFILVIAALIAGGGWMIFNSQRNSGSTIELVGGVLIVSGACVLAGLAWLAFGT